MVDVLVWIILFFAGFNYKNRFKEFDAYDKSLLTKLFFYHILFGIAYYFYVGSNGGDAEMYWSYPQKFSLQDIWLYVRGSDATKYVATLNYIPAHILRLSFFTGNMIYAFVGYVGWIYFYRIMKENIPNFRDISQYKILGFTIFPWIFFLPNLHFWSVAIGKDALLFTCSAVFLYSIKDIPKRFVGLAITAIIAALIRPHILFFLIAAAGGATLLNRQVQTHKKVLLLVVFAIGFYLMIDRVMAFANLDSIDLGTIENFTTDRASRLSRDRYTSSVDTSNYPILLKIFTFLFRPLFFDASGFLGIVASMENLFLLIFSFKVATSQPYKAFKKANLVIKSCAIFFVVGSTAFSMILGNLGIMLRQKTPFILVLIVIGFWALTQRRDFIVNNSDN